LDLFVQILIGFGLATACGFRVFIPLWALSLLSLAGKVELVESFQWIGSTPAFIIFSVAVLVEIGVYYIPILDNFIDLVATPFAVVASAVVMSSYIEGIDPLIKYTLLLIASGTVTAVTKSLMAGVRGMSTSLTGGLGNGVVSTLEWILSIVLTVGVLLFSFVIAFYHSSAIADLLFKKKKKKRIVSFLHYSFLMQIIFCKRILRCRK